MTLAIPDAASRCPKLVLTEAIIPTIRSRSQIIYTQQQQTIHLRPFLRHFTQAASSPALFLKELQTDSMEDHEIPEALDQLLSYWTELYIKSLMTDNNALEIKKTHAMITLLQKATEHPPMPGSAKIFWRNVYLAKDKGVSHGTS